MNYTENPGSENVKLLFYSRNLFFGVVWMRVFNKSKGCNKNVEHAPPIAPDKNGFSHDDCKC